MTEEIIKFKEPIATTLYRVANDGETIDGDKSDFIEMATILKKYEINTAMQLDQALKKAFENDKPPIKKVKCCPRCFCIKYRRFDDNRFQCMLCSKVFV